MFKTSELLFEVGKKIDMSKYYVTFDNEELQIWQDELYEILCDVVDVLESYSLQYTLSGGTCLGAVRHQGFIPWDDDIDLNIPRKDFNRLSDAMSNSKFKDKYTVIFPGEALKPITKAVIRRDDKYINELFPNKKMKKNLKMHIDIFPIDSVPDNRLIREILGIFTTWVNLSITSNGYSKENDPLIHELSKHHLGLRFNLLFRWLLSLPTKPFIKYGKIKNKPIRLLNNIFTRIAQDKTKYSTIYCGTRRYFGEMLETSVFFPTQKAYFRNREFSVPGDYDKYLTNLYGDYMTMPKEDDKKIHYLSFDF